MKAADVLGIVASLISIVGFALAFFLNVHHARDLKSLLRRVARVFAAEARSGSNESDAGEKPAEEPCSVYYESVEYWPTRSLLLIIVTSAIGGAHAGLFGKAGGEILQTYTHTATSVSSSIHEKIITIENKWGQTPLTRKTGSAPKTSDKRD